MLYQRKTGNKGLGKELRKNFEGDNVMIKVNYAVQCLETSRALSKFEYETFVKTGDVPADAYVKKQFMPA